MERSCKRAKCAIATTNLSIEQGNAIYYYWENKNHFNLNLSVQIGTMKPEKLGDGKQKDPARLTYF